jgi:hypothetical protein
MSAVGKAEMPPSASPWALRFSKFTDRHDKP